jgi:hypothetical protein
MMHPSEEVLLLNALDMVVFERMPDGSLVLASRSTAWFERAFPQAGSHQDRRELTAMAPFIETFLIDAEDLWASPRARLYAGHWVQRDIDGFNRNIEAWAVNAGARRFLVLRLLGPEFDEARRALQELRSANLADELSAVEKPPESRFPGSAGLWFARFCLAVFCLVSLGLFTLQGFRLWEFHLEGSFMNWVGVVGLASLIGLLLLEKSGRAAIIHRPSGR